MVKPVGSGDGTLPPTLGSEITDEVTAEIPILEPAPIGASLDADGIDIEIPPAPEHTPTAPIPTLATPGSVVPEGALHLTVPKFLGDAPALTATTGFGSWAALVNLPEIAPRSAEVDHVLTEILFHLNGANAGELPPFAIVPSFRDLDRIVVAALEARQSGTTGRIKLGEALGGLELDVSAKDLSAAHATLLAARMHSVMSGSGLFLFGFSTEAIAELSPKDKIMGTPPGGSVTGSVVA